jgi:hypothetical protein
MILRDCFLVSKNPYAVLPDTFKVVPDAWGQTRWYQIQALWFRHRTRYEGGDRSTYPVACVGVLRHPTHRVGTVLTYVDFLQNFIPTYGGDCYGRWDGHRYWGSQIPAEQDEHLQILRPALDAYPHLPYGYIGWWSKP